MGSSEGVLSPPRRTSSGWPRQGPEQRPLEGEEVTRDRRIQGKVAYFTSRPWRPSSEGKKYGDTAQSQPHPGHSGKRQRAASWLHLTHQAHSPSPQLKKYLKRKEKLCVCKPPSPTHTYTIANVNVCTHTPTYTIADVNLGQGERLLSFQ